jgi:hypothetical protein
LETAERPACMWQRGFVETRKRRKRKRIERKEKREKEN